MKTVLWNTLFNGSLKTRENYKNAYPREKGLSDLSKEKLGGKDCPEFDLLREVIFEAARQRDKNFIYGCAWLCKALSINHQFLVDSSEKIWALEDAE
jgi:hypothetical protein